MSRVGNNPIKIPQGVEVKITGQMVDVKGPKGTLHQEVPAPIAIKIENGEVLLTRRDELSLTRSMHGMIRTLVSNMVTGVSKGYMRDLEIVGVGFKAEVKGSNKVEMALGFTHPVVVELPAGVRAEVDKTTNILKLTGPDKQVLGQLAANIRGIKPPEPYKGKGIKYVGEVIRRKAGKAAAGASSS